MWLVCGVRKATNVAGFHRFYCHAFRCISEEKAYALALAVAKAFYLAYQVYIKSYRIAGNFRG